MCFDAPGPQPDLDHSEFEAMNVNVDFLKADVGTELAIRVIIRVRVSVVGTALASRKH